MTKQMKKKIFVAVAAAGWPISGFLMWQLLSGDTEERGAVGLTKTGEQVRHASGSVNRSLKAVLVSPISKVYVRPHPDGFLTGRWIAFQSFNRRTAGATEFIDFLLEGNVTSVPSEAVDWPKQSPRQEFR